MLTIQLLVYPYIFPEKKMGLFSFTNQWQSCKKQPIPPQNLFYRSEEHTSELQSLPTRRSSDLDSELAKVFYKNTTIEKISNLTPDHSGNVKNANYSIIGVPLHLPGEKNGAVFIYQSMAVMQETTHSTTKFILQIGRAHV